VRYIPHTDREIRSMLEAVGAASVDALFDSIPEKLRLEGALLLPPALSEQEVMQALTRLSARNANSESHAWFLGAGVYPHFIPSAIDALISRAEFMTAYTPYQPEISQGTLQAIFEWQTMICSLTGLEVANASLYDGASATAEAVLMALRITKRRKVVLSGALHPNYRGVVRTYLGGLDAELVSLPLAADGRSSDLSAHIDSDTACVVLQQPNFLGCIEDVVAAARAAHAVGAQLIVCVNEALSLALLEAPGAQGADIVCGEAQSFGVPMSLGGPHLGFLAAREKQVRQLPGRLVGETIDGRGQRGYVLTLATREQHIRREKATSNICTNQGLCLLMATIYLSLLGPDGLRKLAEHNFAKAAYARRRVSETRGLSLTFAAPAFNEFVVRVPDSAARAQQRALDAGVVAGLDLATHYPELGPALLLCVTELASREQIDALVAALAGGTR
jgi:glycine dehydrogenase subunit 1